MRMDQETLDYCLSIGDYESLKDFDKLPYEAFSNKRLCLMSIEDWDKIPPLAKEANFFFNLDFSLKQDLEVVVKSLQRFNLDDVLPYVSYTTFMEVLSFAYAKDPLKIQEYEYFKSFVLNHKNKHAFVFNHTLRLLDHTSWDQLFYPQIDLSQVY